MNAMSQKHTSECSGGKNIFKIFKRSNRKSERYKFCGKPDSRRARTSKSGNPRFLPRHPRDDQSSTSIIWPNHGPVPPRLDLLTSVTCAKSRRVARIQERGGVVERRMKGRARGGISIAPSRLPGGNKPFIPYYN